MKRKTFLAHTLEHISKATEWHREELCHCLNVPASQSNRITKAKIKPKPKKKKTTNKRNESEKQKSTWNSCDARNLAGLRGQLNKWNLDLDMAAFGFYAPCSIGGNLVWWACHRRRPLAITELRHMLHLLCFCPARLQPPGQAHLLASAKVRS